MKKFFLALYFFCFLAKANFCEEKKENHYKALIHIHTTHSCGANSIFDYYKFALENDIQILIFADHLKNEFEYGVKPFDKTIPARRAFNSIDEKSIKKYLEEIQFCNLQYNNRVLGIDGVEINPCYWTSGTYWGGDLSLNDARKHILAIGLNDENYYKQLINITNSPNLDTNKVFSIILVSCLMLFILITILRTITLRKIFAFICAIFLCAIVLLSIVNSLTRQNRRNPDFTFESFSKIADYVNSKGGVTFIAHPESLLSATGESSHNFVEKTSPYPESALLTENYNAFAGVYGESTTMTNLHNLWDKLLLEYCKGNTKNPPFIYSEPDLHFLPEKNGANFITVIVSEKLERDFIIQSIKKGRMYATAGTGNIPQLNFYVSIDDKIYHSGDKIFTNKNPTVFVEISGKSNDEFYVFLVCDDKVIETVIGKIPIILSKTPELANGVHYFRTDIFAKETVNIKSNPIFVEKRE